MAKDVRSDGSGTVHIGFIHVESDDSFVVTDAEVDPLNPRPIERKRQVIVERFPVYLAKTMAT